MRFGNTPESGKAGLGIAPEALNAVDMRVTLDTFTFAMVNAEVLFIAHIDQTVITRPFVGVNDRINGHPTPDNSLQSLGFDIGNNLSVHLSVPFEKSEHNNLAAGTPASLAAVFAAEVAFVHFHLTADRGELLAELSDAFPDGDEIAVNRVAVETRDGSNLTGI